MSSEIVYLAFRTNTDNHSLLYSLATAADITHGALPDLRHRLVQLEEAKKEEEKMMRAAGGEALAGDTVTPEAIQQVVAQWSGIPVTSMKVRSQSFDTFVALQDQY